MSKAQACILLTNKKSRSSFEDQRNILNALSIKKYVYGANIHSKDFVMHNMRIILQLIKPESKNLYAKSQNLSWANDQVIIVEEIKMNLLAKSCFAPGLISLISNLIASSGDCDDEFDSDWVQDYALGMGNEIYRKKIDHTEFEDFFKFKDIAEIAHSQWGAIVFALEI